MESDRFKRWQLVSNGLLSIKPELAATMRMLGKIDADLFFENEKFKKLRNNMPSATSEELKSLHDAIAISHLWVLGAYEAVRTIYQHIYKSGNFSERCKQELSPLKVKFERVRMPLAKLERPKRHSSDDYGVAYPAINSDHGIGWILSESCFCSRNELSCDLLAFLELLKSEHKPNQAFNTDSL